VGDALQDWPRRHYAPGGGDPFLFYAVFGPVSESVSVSPGTYRCDGVPEGLEADAYSLAGQPEVINSLREGYVIEQLRRENPGLVKAIFAQDSCLVLKGRIADPPTLNYFRNVIGLVTHLLDHGGVAVFDPQMLKWWSAAEWRTEVFAPAEPLPRQHVVILVSPEDHGTHWFHTRGLRKFGRPDLSIRRVRSAHQAAMTELCNRFIELQAFGGVIPEGQEIRMHGVPAGMRCVHRGDENDPDFNNAHVEIVWKS
jgi:hypothetical protein